MSTIPRSWAATLGAMASASLVFTSPVLVHAHGGIPRAIAIVDDPSDPLHWVVQSDAWGLFESRDGGVTFHWICAESYEGDSLGVLHPSIQISARGETLIANLYAGLQRSSDDSCGWTRVGAFGNSLVQDVVRTPTGELFVLASEAGEARLWHASDGGQSWQPFGSQLASGSVPESLAVRSGMGVLYVGARALGTSSVVVLRSEDGGRSWTTFETGVETRAGQAIVTADPVSDDRVYLRIDAQPASQTAADPPDSLWMSSNGAVSWTLLLQAAADLPGLAFSPGGSELAVAGPREGLLVAEVAALANLGAEAFEQRYAEPVWALAWRTDGLWAGHDDFTPGGTGFTLGRSEDEGRTFEPIFSVCDSRLLDCGASPSARTVCADTFTRLGGFEQAILLSSRCIGEGVDAGPNAADAATRPVPPASSGGCNCAQPTQSPGAAGSLVALAVGAVVIGRSRRRRARR